MNEQHLHYLINCEHIPQQEVGFNAYNWALQVLPAEKYYLIDNELNQVFCRNSLFAYCANPNKTNLNVSLAILAWGGRQFIHGRKIYLNSWDVLCQILNNIRNNGYQYRQEAFNAFHVVRANGQLQGLGIAFYTKLICFLAPKLNGYIMDQWTSKSINLLFDEPLVNLNEKWVKDTNTPEIYETFCRRIEMLAKRLGVQPLVAEERIFSSRTGLWRKYVKSQIYKPLKQRIAMKTKTSHFVLYETQNYWGIRPEY